MQRMLVRAGLGPALFFALLVLAACSRPPETVVLSGQTMGTTWTVRLGVGPQGLDLPSLRAEIEAVLEQVNAEMSTYRPDAVITAFNQAQAGETIELPEGFARVLDAALALAADSDGAFDPTVGPLVNLWGFGPDAARDQVPEPEALAAARARVGWTRLDWDPQTRRLRQPGGAFLDLSAIAKGWGVDLVSEHLKARGIDDWLVDIGGDMRISGRRPGGGPWRIAIERPVPGTRDIHQIVELSDIAIATSGSYRNFFESGGRRFSHTIDPRTGWPVDHHTVSVTVLAETCMEADGLATALGVLSPDEAERFARERGLAVLWLLEQDGHILERATPEFYALTGLEPR